MRGDVSSLWLRDELNLRGYLKLEGEVKDPCAYYVLLEGGFLLKIR